MKRILVVLVAVAATLGAIASPTPVRAGVSADINIRVGDRRPAPVVVFDREPDVVLVPRSRVYYVEHDNYDLYRYGRYWYINDGGFWFRASSYRGPFVSISVGRVPRSIVVVPARYRRHPAHPHGGPPGQMKKVRGVYRDDDRYRGDDRRRGDRYRDDDRRDGRRTTTRRTDRREDRRDDRRAEEDRNERNVREITDEVRRKK
jgi:hypothetical protein